MPPQILASTHPPAADVVLYFPSPQPTLNLAD